jgi:transposase InsO family protein
VSKARLVITAVVVEGRPVREVSTAYGVARSWIYELLARYRKEGDQALEPRSRRPHNQPRAIPASTVALIIRLRHQLTGQGLDAGSHTIAWHLAEQHQLTVSEATIWRTLNRAGLIIPEPKKKPKSAYICFAAEQPNEMWQVDFTHYRLTRHDGTPGADVEILCFIDDHSRYALSVTCHQPVTGPVVVAVFQQAVADQGIPASVLSDNGMVFTTRFAGGRAGRDTLNGFSAELRHLKVAQKHSRPNHPTTCGKVERFQQTLKKWLKAQPQQPETVAELQPSATRSWPTTTTPGRTAPWAAPRPPPTRPDPKPPRLAQPKPSRTPESATTSSTAAAHSPSATQAGYTTSASVEPTPEPPS